MGMASQPHHQALALTSCRPWSPTHVSAVQLAPASNARTTTTPAVWPPDPAQDPR